MHADCWEEWRLEFMMAIYLSFTDPPSKAYSHAMKLIIRELQCMRAFVFVWFQRLTLQNLSRRQV